MRSSVGYSSKNLGKIFLTPFRNDNSETPSEVHTDLTSSFS